MTVTVIVVVLVPSAVTEAGLATTLELVLLGTPATNVTVVVSVTEPMVAVMVLLCATVDANVAENMPEALVLPLTGERVLLEPLLARVTAWPDMRLPCASLTVTVNVVVLVPSAVADVGDAATLEVAALGAPGINETLVVATTEPIVAVTVLLCATDDDRVAENTPEALVVPETGEKVLPEPVLLKLTVCPATGLLLASLTVTFRVVVLTPSAVTEVGLAVKVVSAWLGAPVVNVTLALRVNVPTKAVITLVSAVVEVTVATNSPEASVRPLTGVSVLFEPVLLKDTA